MPLGRCRLIERRCCDERLVPKGDELDDSLFDRLDADETVAETVSSNPYHQLVNAFRLRNGQSDRTDRFSRSVVAEGQGP